MRGGIGLLATAALLAFLHPARSLGAGGVGVECRPLWDGGGKVTAPTELDIRLKNVTGPIELELTTEQARYAARASAAPDGTATIRIPFWLGDGDTVSLSARGAWGQVQHRLAVPRRGTGPFVALVASGRARFLSSGLPDGTSLLYPPADALPRSPGSYDAVDALVVDASALARLDERQLATLADHLGTGGRLLVSGSTPEALSALKANAAGGGAFVAAADDPIGPALSALLQRSPPAPESPDALRSLLPRVRSMAPVLPWVVVAYATLLLLCALTVRKAWPLLVLPPVASLGIALASLSGPPPAIACWSEIWGPVGPARFSALLRLEGSGRGRAQISFGKESRLPRLVSSSGAVHFDLGQSGAGPRILTVQAPLFTRRDLSLLGSLALTPPLSLNLEGETPVVRPGASTPSPPAVLAWNHDLFSVPPLRAGEKWCPSPGALRRDPNEAEKLLLTRSETGSPLLLLPHVPEWASRLGTTSGWLVISPPPPVKL